MDKRKKRVLTVLCVGSLVLVWRVYAICTKYLPSSAKAQPQPAVLDSTPASVMPTFQLSTPSPGLSDQALTERIKLQEQVANRGWGRDPFEALEPAPIETAGGTQPVEPVALQAPPAPEMKIVGVSARNGVWIAVMNGNVYRIGDRTPNGFDVREITRNSVTLGSNGWAYIYTLGFSEPTVARIDGGDD